MARKCVQIAALAVFTYQMVLVLGKYLTFSSTTVEETKDIKDAILPSTFVCEKGMVTLLHTVFTEFVMT